MRLIDADELLNELDRLDLDYGAMGGIAECIATIDNAPTIEPSGDLVFRGGKIPPKEMLGGTVLIPKHQWLEMERELAELKEKLRLAEPCKSTEQNVADVPSGDLISRADAIKAVTRLCVDGYKAKVDGYFISLTDALINTLSELPSAEPKGANLINRHDATTVIREECLKCNNLTNADLLGRILALPTSQQTDCTDFIMWLIEVVLDDEDWELNAVGYGEIIARKLKKLGLLEVKDGYYIRSSAEAKDTQTEEQARYVAKETELAHIEARLECAEKRLQEMPRCLNGMKEKQITKISADRPSNVLQEKKPTPIEDYMTGKSRSADRPQINSAEWVEEKEKEFEELNRPQVNSNSAEEQIAETCDRPKGEWIMHIDDLFPEESTQECSNCHEYENIQICNDNFCPNCGADMRCKK